MPTYRYVCPAEHTFEVWRSIKEATVWELPCAECSRIATMHMTSPAIAADALPNKMHGVRAIDAKDKQLEKDLVSYKALRSNGLQPRQIDGAHKIETVSDHPLEVEMGRRLGKASDVQRAQEISSELLGQDCTKVGSEVGAAKRGAA